MKRTDSDGSTVDNKFTNGDPLTGVPATVVDADWLNSLQEEIALFIESQGITLDQTGVDLTQLQDALNSLVEAGSSIADFSIPNNQTTPTDVTDLVFDKLVTKSARVFIDISRETATQNFVEAGEIYVRYDSVNDNWDLTLNTNFDDAGCVFSITSAGQVQITSSNLTGGSYVGTLKMTEITKIAI